MPRRDVDAVADAVASGYGITPVAISPIVAGTATSNYHVTADSGREWFVKVYRDHDSLADELAAVELALFARAGGIPVPAIHRTRDGAMLHGGPLPMSVWQFLGDVETAEGGLRAGRWEAIGSALGTLHRRLAGHPAGAPISRAGCTFSDLRRARERFDRLIAAYDARPRLTPFERWAVAAARERIAVLPRVAELLAGLPALRTQVVHGDLAAPNLLLRGDDVAAFIDFQPPRPQFLSWEIARIGCDPRTVTDTRHDWLPGLIRLIGVYRQTNPMVTDDDLISVVACGCIYTLASTYPLAEPLHSASAVGCSLAEYGRARHESALLLLDRATEATEAVRDSLR